MDLLSALIVAAVAAIVCYALDVVRALRQERRQERKHGRGYVTRSTCRD